MKVNTVVRQSNLGSGSAQYVFPSNFSPSTLGEVNYRFEFDFFLVSGTGASCSSYFAVRGENGIIAVVEIGQNTSTAKVYKLADGSLSQVGTYTINGRGTSSQTGSNWYHAVIAADTEKGLSLELTLEGAASSALNVTLGSYDHLSKLYTYQTTDNANYPVDWGFDNFALKTPASSDVPDEPEIGISEDTTADDDIKIVTISLAEGTTTGVSLYYRVGASGDYTLADGTSQTLNISSTSTIYAYADNNGTSSEIASLYVIAGVLATPTGAITGVNGTSRTATFYSDYSLEYNTTAADGVYVDYSAPITVSDSTTFYVRAKKTSTIDANVTLYSAVLTFVVTAGEGSEVQLATPSLRRKGFGYVYVRASQADVISAPTADIHYTVNGGEEVTVPASVETYIPIDGKHGTSVTVWVEKDGFTASESATYAVDYSTVPANYKKVASVDIVGICRASNQGVSYSSDTIDIFNRSYHTSFAIGEGKLTDAESKIPMYFNKDIRAGSGSRWNNSRENGLYCYSLPKYVAIKDLEAGDIIYANASSASASQNLSLRSSSDYEYFFNVVANGDVEMQFSANSYIYGICVYKKRKGFMLVIQ